MVTMKEERIRLKNEVYVAHIIQCHKELKKRDLDYDRRVELADMILRDVACMRNQCKDA